ncbi:MAG: alcohol dehydrogenase catalytic domain-containing protein [Oscillospiraceae bacterium]|nr:alcohol dehydrogenase catalytic domain-containing protein [Oscillospiraceae bacterium]
MNGIFKHMAAPGAEYRTDLPIPEVGPTDLLVRVHVAAICGTDQHIYHWNEYASTRVPVPMVFGHEFAGDVVAVGESVRSFRVGDRVATETHIPCGHCYQCMTGNQHNCEEMKIIGVHVPGAFSDYAVIPEACAWRFDDSLSYRHAAMLEPMGVAVHGVFSGEIALQKTVILGCGPIGVMAVGAAYAGGAAGVMAVDIFDDKLAMAKKLGASELVNTRRDNLVQRILAWTDGRGADVIIDYTGNVGLIEEAFGGLRKAGRFTMVGLPSKKLSLDLTNAVVYKEAHINGSTGRLMYQTWYQCEAILKSGAISLDDVIGGVYDMRDFERAFADIAAGHPGKMLFLTDYGKANGD